MTLTRIFLLLLLTATLSACRKIECEEFNFSHPVMKWHFFPDIRTGYTFINADNDSVIFLRTKFEYDRHEERRCNSCACMIDQTTYYHCAQLGTQLHCDVGYETLNGWNNTLYFGVDQIGSSFRDNDSNITENEFLPHEKIEFDVQVLDSITLVNRNFQNVFQFRVLDTTKAKLTRFWLIKDMGIVAIEGQNKMWVRRP